MSTPIVTARRNLAQRISKLLLKGGEISLTAWQLRQVQSAIEQLEEERFAEGERTMSEAERPDLYEPGGLAPRNRLSGSIWSTSWRRWLLLHSAAVACTAARPHVAACCHC